MKLSTIKKALVLTFGLSAAMAMAEPFKVVTTFTVIQDIAQNVAGDKATVESITKPGAEIHDYQPTPKDIVKAQKADLVLWNGMNLERWFERFFENVKGKPAVVVTEGITQCRLPKVNIKIYQIRTLGCPPITH